MIYKPPRLSNRRDFFAFQYVKAKTPHYDFFAGQPSLDRTKNKHVKVGSLPKKAVRLDRNSSMAWIVVRYSHDPKSAIPRPMKAERIWQMAADVRHQMFGQTGRVKIDISQIVRRTQAMTVNDVPMSTYWDIDHSVTDMCGQSVMGETSINQDEPNTIMVSINNDLILYNKSLALSSCCHELGHILFDGPGWIRNIADGHQVPSQKPLMFSDSVLVRPKQGVKAEKSNVDWSEWRANEFMGGFLVPKKLLKNEMVKSAASYGVSVLDGKSGSVDDDLVVDILGSDQYKVSCFLDWLAERFGVSVCFIKVRLAKYNLIYTQSQRSASNGFW